MKKFLFGFIMLFMLALSVNAENLVTNSIDSVYHDGKALVDTVYHDGKEVVKTVYSDAKVGAAEIYPDVKSAIISIGKAIGVAAEHVYTVLVKKYIVIGIKEAAVLVLSIISVIIGLVMWRKYTKNGQPITYGILVPGLLIMVGLVSMIKVDYDAMLMGIINPEYGAINYIIEYTKNIVK